MRKHRIHRKGRIYEYPTFYVHIDEELAAKVDRLKEIRGGTYAAIGREALEAFITRPDIVKLLAEK